MSEGPSASILAADDDPVSLQFLASALREFGCLVTAVENGNAALSACARSEFDLLLLDRRMPGLGGAALLHALRSQGCKAPAIAASAELDADLRRQLAAAGYAGTITKPIDVDQLADLLERLLPQHPSSRYVTPGSSGTKTATAVAAPALLDDTAALASVGGDRETLRALRGLFVKELETALPRIAATPDDELGAWLHRLRASCRYCGATRLAEAAERLELGLKASADGGKRELAEFTEACALTIRALS
jgi:CheY-like chemotaxis protein/HPt (histidine-containing phosphotransfer) domain-containing protein